MRPTSRMGVASSRVTAANHLRQLSGLPSRLLHVAPLQAATGVSWACSTTPALSSPSLLRLKHSSSMDFDPRMPVMSRMQRIGRSTTVHVSSAVEAASSGSTEGAALDSSEFQELGMIPELLEALSQLNIEKPTEVQKLSFPAILQGNDVLMTSHTGSGKTLAYLLPIVHALKQQEKEGFVPAPKRPRVIVLGPTKELTEQITTVGKALSHTAKIRVVCGNTQGQRKAVQESRLSGALDIVVTSPTKLLQHLADKHIFLRDVQWLVLDEADTLFAEGWGTELGQILVSLRSKTQPARVVLVSATMTKPIKRLLTSQFPDIKAVQTTSTHKAIQGSKHTFTTLPPGKDKLAALSEVLSIDRKKVKTLVFCNSVDSCRAVDHYCNEAGIPTVCYHGDMPVDARAESMQTFSTAAPDGSGETPVMIATDVAARGLDFPGHVDHVINFDFPFTAVDYIHRSGRTARAGRTGRITSVVTKRDRVLAERIEWALKHNESLDQLSSNPDILPPSQRPKPAEARSRDGGPGRGGAGGRGGGRGSGGRSGGRSGASEGSRRGAGRVALMQERLAEKSKGRGDGKRGGRGGPGGSRSTGGRSGSSGGRSR